MFAQTLEKIIKRQNYIDQLSQEQIATIQTKELFFKALEESPNIESHHSPSDQPNQTLIFSPNMDSPATNLLKHILPAAQNSYEEIEQLQARISIYNSPKLNQVQILKSMFEQEKNAIKASNLKVSDFLQLYESQQMQNQQKDINDPLTKKIMTYFETNTKEISLHELLQTIIEAVSIEEQHEEEDNARTKVIKRIRQSVCSLQGFVPNMEENESQFNQETKKQMDRIMSLYHNFMQIFDIECQD